MRKLLSKGSVWRRRAARTLAYSGIAYLALLAGAAIGHRRFVFPAPASALEPMVPGAELVRFDADGVPVVALWGAPKAGAPVIVFFHGNAEELVDTSSFARALLDRGFGVLFVEYPGYGLAASGTPREATIYAAAQRALEELAKPDGFAGPSKRSIVLVGHSLGTGVAVEMAKRGFGDRMVLVSPYTSMIAMVKRFVPILPVGLFVTDRFDTLAKAPDVKIPTLVVHGDEDPLIPLEMGRTVAAAIDGAELAVIAGGRHNLFSANPRSMVDRIDAFAARGAQHAGVQPPRDERTAFMPGRAS